MKKIYGITFKNCYGQKVALYEDDFYSHDAFMSERRSLKAKGLNIKDLNISKVLTNRTRKTTLKKNYT